MQQNARFTFQTYSNPDWPCFGKRPRAYTFVPDEILGPVLSTLQSNAHEILKYADDMILRSLKTGRVRTWSWPETLALVQDVWNDLAPEYGQRVAQAIDDAAFRYEDVSYGMGTGFCFSDYLLIQRDESLNDPVCAAHESGHLMAELMAPDQDDREPASNIKEIQAMFIQEHAYARLIAQARDQDENESVRLHRLSYYTGILSNIPLYMYMLDRQSKKPSRNLAQEFTRWSVAPATISHLKRRHEDPEEDDRKDPQHLHTHPFAAMLAPALYEVFQAKDDQAKRNILSVMFERGPEATLTDVLSAFDIETPEDVRRVAARTCDNLEGEISRYTFRMPVFQALRV